MNHLKETLLTRIRREKLSMRPKMHFLLYGGLIALACLLVFLSAMYLISFGIFVLYARGALFMGTFGPRGLQELLVAMPFALIFFVLITLGIIEYLTHSFSFSYRRPVLYSLGALLLIVGISGGILFMSGAHEALRDFSERRNVPGMRWLYREFSETPLPRGYPGTILATTTRGFTLATLDGEILEVHVDEDTRMPPGTLNTVGAEVFVGGEREGGVITAFGIHPLNIMHPLHKRGMEKIMRGEDGPKEKRFFAPPPPPRIYPPQ